ncbi:MAG TPA: alpha-galactosidase, partial [Pseudonocardia sp.]|nr:alpha-galactosidase [Pseudonocardia sp.]
MCPSSGSADVVHLRAAGVSLVLDARDGRLPAVLHWGHDLGDVTPADLAALASAGRPTAVPNDLDEPHRPPAVLAEHASGWNGRPGLAGSRSGQGWSPLLVLTGFDLAGGRVVATGADAVAGLQVRLEIELLPSGLVRQRGTVTTTA